MTIAPLVCVQLYWTLPSASAPEPDRETGAFSSTVWSLPAFAVGGLFESDDRSQPVSAKAASSVKRDNSFITVRTSSFSPGLCFRTRGAVGVHVSGLFATG